MPDYEQRLNEFLKFALDQGLVELKTIEGGPWQFRLTEGTEAGPLPEEPLDRPLYESDLPSAEHVCLPAHWSHHWVPVALIAGMAGMLLGVLLGMLL